MYQILISNLNDRMKTMMNKIKAFLTRTDGQNVVENGIMMTDDALLPVDNDGSQDEEHILIANVKNLAKLSAQDVMIPRADIVAIDVATAPEDILATFVEHPLSRFPVYRDNLDEIIGCINMKDVLTAIAKNEELRFDTLMRDVMIISPSLEALDLLVEMRRTKKHLAVVVDEYGGIDGLITIADLVSAVVGEIRDEHHKDQPARLIERADGTILVDARVDVQDLEERFGPFLTDDEREEIDTMGGLCMTIAGHLPVRGELLSHPSGMEIEVIDADPRRIKRVKVTQKPTLQNISDTQQIAV